MSGFGIGRRKGGWSRVVGKVDVEEVLELGSPICGIVAYMALWSLCYVLSVGVVVGGSEGVSSGMHMN